MHPVDVSAEIYGFCCMRCGHAWERTYEVHRSIDYKGDEIVAFYFGGRPATAPVWGGLCCPDCGGFRVRQSPQLHVARDHVANALSDLAAAVEPAVIEPAAVEPAVIEPGPAPA